MTSRPDPARIICDAGFKTTGRGFADPEVIDCGDVTSFSFSAEHGRLTLSQENRSLRPGDQIQFVPGYSDATVFLHDHLYGVRDGRVEAVWPVVGRGKLQYPTGCRVGVLPVSGFEGAYQLSSVLVIT